MGVVSIDAKPFLALTNERIRQVLSLSVLFADHALHGNHPDAMAQHRTLRPSCLTTIGPSFAHMLATLRRVTMSGQFSPTTGRTPRPEAELHRLAQDPNVMATIADVQQAWATAGL